jgi:hypothetical protein
MKEYAHSLLNKYWRELEAAGIPLEPPKYRAVLEARHSGPALTVQQLGTCDDALIRELKDGRIAYVLRVFIRRNHPGKTIIRKIYLSPPWMDTDIEFLEDPLHLEQNRTRYSFPNETEQFGRAEVLNHRIPCTLARGEIREGLLLAVGLIPPPEKFRNNEKIRVTLTLVDQWDTEHPAALRMWLRRLPKRAQVIQKNRRGRLHDHPDAKPE